MQLNLQIDDALLQEARRLGTQQTPQQLVLEALREYIQRRKTREQSSADMSDGNMQVPATWAEWLARNHELSAQILQRRQGKSVDVDAILKSAREDLESRHDDLFGR